MIMSTNRTRDLPNNERVVEVPYLLNHVVGAYLLDIGADRGDYYTSALKERGVRVVTCDPWAGAHADYPVRFEDLKTDEKFDTILLLSSLEHFDNSDDNLHYAETDVSVIRKCREMLTPNGRIIITVPFGKEYIHDDFIQWDNNRLAYVKWMCEIVPDHELVARWDSGEWTPVLPNEWRLLRDLEYRANGALNAAAVYCGVWRF